MKHSFWVCGTVGVCMEVAWTGCHALCKKDFRMMGSSSILMFPIYGLASCIGPISRRLGKVPRMVRGCVYGMGFFMVEFCSGLLLRGVHACPWDYSGCRCHYKGLIRLDYAPLWMAAGLFFEKILEDKS